MTKVIESGDINLDQTPIHKNGVRVTEAMLAAEANSYICDYGYTHDTSKRNPPKEKQQPTRYDSAEALIAALDED